MVEERLANGEAVFRSRDPSHRSRDLEAPIGGQGEFVGVF